MDERVTECNNNCSMLNVNDFFECVFQCQRRSTIEIRRLPQGCRSCLREIEFCIKTSKHCDYSCDIATLDAIKCQECAYMTGCLIGKCINPAYSIDLFWSSPYIFYLQVIVYCVLTLIKKINETSDCELQGTNSDDHREAFLSSAPLTLW